VSEISCVVIIQIQRAGGGLFGVHYCTIHLMQILVGASFVLERNIALGGSASCCADSIICSGSCDQFASKGNSLENFGNDYTVRGG
jgi:hypothetical protein